HEQPTEEVSPYRFLKLGLMPEPRALLHERIERRFDLMLERGLVEEVKFFFDRGDLNVELPSMRSVGYRQVWMHLAGEYDRDEMRLRGVAATRQLAKRQFTWLRSWPELIRLASVETNLDDALGTVEQFANVSLN
ncbi:MAG: tRNA (adenosine(37)-N6)-dimethylallyltransferase MiaA, partial [Gammaproteobacteria bacterium]